MQTYSDPPKSNKNHHKSLNQNAESSFLIKIYIHQVKSTTPTHHPQNTQNPDQSIQAFNTFHLSPIISHFHIQTHPISHFSYSLITIFPKGFFFPNFFFLSMEQLRFRFLVSLPLFFLLLASFPFSTESTCTRGCSLALGSYYMWKGSNLTYISSKLTYTSNFQKLHFFRNPFFLSLVKYQSFTLCSRLQLENCK